MLENLDTQFFHEVCIYVLIASCVVLTFVIIERFIYYVLLNSRANGLSGVMNDTRKFKEKKVEKIFKRRDLISRRNGLFRWARI